MILITNKKTIDDIDWDRLFSVELEIWYFDITFLRAYKTTSGIHIWDLLETSNEKQDIMKSIIEVAKNNL